MRDVVTERMRLDELRKEMLELWGEPVMDGARYKELITEMRKLVTKMLPEDKKRRPRH
jgi:hypothetical protein